MSYKKKINSTIHSTDIQIPRAWDGDEPFLFLLESSDFDKAIKLAEEYQPKKVEFYRAQKTAFIEFEATGLVPIGTLDRHGFIGTSASDDEQRKIESIRFEGFNWEVRCWKNSLSIALTYRKSEKNKEKIYQAVDDAFPELHHFKFLCDELIVPLTTYNRAQEDIERYQVIKVLHSKLSEEKFNPMELTSSFLKAYDYH